MSNGPSFVRLGEDNPHRRAYDQFRAMLYAFLRQRRGRQSQLARHLHVRRQTISRWVTLAHSSAPAWAALASNVWMHRQLTPETRNALLASACPPGARQPKTKPRTSHQQLTLTP